LNENSVSLSDVSIIDSNVVDGIPTDFGSQKAICNQDLCGAKTLEAFRLTIAAGQTFDVQSAGDYHLVYLIQAVGGMISLNDQNQTAESGAGLLLTPGEEAKIVAAETDIDALHLVVPSPPAEIEDGLPGGPGYVFNRDSLRVLSDASGGRVRRFCAESTVRLLDGSRLTPTNAIQAGEMHYKEGGSSPYHQHMGTEANPDGSSHVYMTFKGQGVVQVGETTQVIEPGTLVFFPTAVPHQLHAYEGPLDYFEIQAWKSFKTNVLSEEELGLKWYYDPESPGAERVEWDQT